MSAAPDVSVIIPYYNHGGYLHAAVQSALAATRRTIEVLVVDDGAVEPGAPGFLKAARALSPAVRVISKANGGLSSARNAGLDAARGAYVQFLDSDDVLYPGKIDLQIQHLQTRPGLGGSICHYALGDEWLVRLDTQYDSIGRFPLTPSSFLFRWERGFSVPIHCGLFRRSLFETLRFNTTVAGKEDWIFWTDLLYAEPEALAYLPVLGAVYRMHGSGMTRAQALMGESFLAAAAHIGDRWRERYPSFDAASARWHRRYYAPRIDREQLETPPAAQPLAATARVATHAQPSTARSGDRVAPGLLDVVTPVYNHFDHLETCVASVLAQPEVGRMILIDDASPDPRVEPFLRGWADREPRLTYVRNKTNAGISVSQNLGVSLSEATFIGFVDCDDFLAPGAGAALVAHMHADPADYYFTDRIDIDADGRRLRVARYGGYDWLSPSGSIEDDLVMGMVATHWKVIRRESYLALGGSNELLSGIQDWALALKACGKLKFSYLPQPLYRHRIHAAAVTSGAHLSQMWRSNMARRRHIERMRPETGPMVRVTHLSGHAEMTRLARRTLSDGARLWFDDAGRDISIPETDLLREFNSLFERIRLGEHAAVALSGYLWDHHLVEVADAATPANAA